MKEPPPAVDELISEHVEPKSEEASAPVEESELKDSEEAKSEAVEEQPSKPISEIPASTKATPVRSYLLAFQERS